jgi:teichuronic acid biosynthesis glycosyltransferase TuaG
MPARNARRFIGAAIASVVAQTVTNWELLIIDDASDDNTADMVAEFHDPRIIYRRVTRIGSPAGVRKRWY